MNAKEYKHYKTEPVGTRKAILMKKKMEKDVPLKFKERVDISVKSVMEPVVLKGKRADYFISQLNEKTNLDEGLRALLNKKPRNLTDFF